MPLLIFSAVLKQIIKSQRYLEDIFLAWFLNSSLQLGLERFQKFKHSDHLNGLSVCVICKGKHWRRVV